MKDARQQARVPGVTSRRGILRLWLRALWSIASGPLAGWICLAGTFLVVGVSGLLRGDVGRYLQYPGLWVAAVALNACTWLAAMLSGQTHQLRASWLAYTALLLVFVVARLIWPSWEGELDMVIIGSLIDLGLPMTIVRRLAILGQIHPPWAVKRVLDALAPWDILLLPYFQAFVLLPLLFRWRARAVARELEDNARSDGGAQQP
jgi:hypothetical protein